MSGGFWSKIIDFIFPKHCLGCGKNGEIFCFRCLNNVPKAKPPGEKIYPALDYRDEKLKRALWLFKYGGYSSFAGIFGEIIYDRILEETADLKIFSGSGEFLIIPIPLSPDKLKKRGFNQSELIARKICGEDGGKSFILRNDILIKTRETESQMSIKERGKRLKNLAGSFAVKNGAELAGKNVIIIDDVITTGTTVSEAARVLREAGAGEILAFTVAH